jgi:hypothetical protein
MLLPSLEQMPLLPEEWDERFQRDVAMYLPNYVASRPKGINFHRPHYENLKSYTINPLTA